MEFLTFIVVLLAIIVTNKMWSAWLSTKSDDVQLWSEDTKTEQQTEIKKVFDKRSKLIKKHGDKWFNLDDIRALAGEGPAKK